MADFLAALGLFFVIEGVLYAAAPGLARRLAESVRDMSNDDLRTGGLVALGLGVVIVWVVRG